jgi:protein TonB
VRSKFTPARIDPEKAISFTVVALLHVAAFWGLWQHRLLPSPVDVATLFVTFIAPPPQNAAEPKRAPPPKPRSIEKPKPHQVVAEAPAIAPTDYVAPPPLAPAIEAPSPPPAQDIEAPSTPPPAGPVALSSELSVACPERSAPGYPVQSRRLGETGTVVLRVELAESGQITTARVESSSGHVRLDEAALAAVKTWRCSPARRDGQLVRAVARQPFRFALQGN